jgi:hypothetical protein
MKFAIWDLSKICREKSSFIKIRHEWKVLCLKTNIQLLTYLGLSFLEWEMFRTNVVEKIKTHILCSITFFENRVVYEICEKILLSGADHRWQYGACTLHAGSLRKQIHTLKSCNTHCFSTATVVAWTPRNITPYVHCLSGYHRQRYELGMRLRPKKHLSIRHTVNRTHAVYEINVWFPLRIINRR